MSSVRTPVCADDRWYPRDAAQLRQLLNRLLGNVPEHALDGELIALLAPHASYNFSGQTAAYAYNQLLGRGYTRAVVVGPSHFGDFGPYAFNRSDYYATPLGRVELDKAFIEFVDAKARVLAIAQDREHSLEMQLPFLQRTLGKFKLAPLMMSRPFYHHGLSAYNACGTLSEALTPLLDSGTILIASSDLSHLHEYDAVLYFDQVFENLIAAYDIGGLVDFMINEGEPRACGDMAIITVLMAAKARGATKVVVLHRTNSGDVTGNTAPGQYTVGYMAAAIYKEKF